MLDRSYCFCGHGAVLRQDHCGLSFHREKLARLYKLYGIGSSLFTSDDLNEVISNWLLQHVRTIRFTLYYTALLRHIEKSQRCGNVVIQNFVDGDNS